MRQVTEKDLTKQIEEDFNKRHPNYKGWLCAKINEDSLVLKLQEAITYTASLSELRNEEEGCTETSLWQQLADIYNQMLMRFECTFDYKED